MKVTPALKKELAQWLDTYWITYIKGDIETWATFIRDDYRNIGGTKEEIWNSKQEIIDYTTRILDQMIGTAEIRNREIEVIPYGEYMMVNEFTDLYLKIEGEWTFYGPFRMSSLLEKTYTGWIALHQHGSYPDMKAMEGEAFSIDAVKAENAKLLEAVKSRTIELEIEAALERVRAVAMGMKKPEDMLDVCRIISDQLQQFGVDHIRNVQTAIIDENIGQYLCYQFFPAYDQTTIEDTEYHKSPVEQEMVREMLASRDGHFIGSLMGEVLEDFRLHRKRENYFSDPLLDEASKVSYCFLSIGEGGLGLSLYQAMEADVLTLFKRFHQVFSLAYQRFREIQKAEQQAREAKIEAATERVRAQSMAMHHPDDLDKVNKEILNQLTWLQVQGLTGVTFYLVDEHGWVKAWDFSSPGNSGDPNSYTLQFDSKKYDLIGEPFRILQQSEQDYFIMDYPIEKLERAVKELDEINPVVAKAFKDAMANGKLNHQWSSCARLSNGILGVDLVNPPTEDIKAIVLKMAGAFNQAYQRFLDLQKAEAQAREAQIQLSLERIRAKAMAMQQSDDLSGFLTVLFEQFDVLNLNPVFCHLSLLDIDNNRSIFRTTGKNGATLIATLEIDLEASPLWKQKVEGWKSGSPNDVDVLYIPYENIPEIAARFNEIRSKLPDDVLPKSEDFPNGQYVIEGNCKYGYIGYSLTRAPSDEEKEITRRIANEFGNVYQRFLDLQKAEAQAREAQIQLSLERIRAKAMAMQHSDELGDFLTVVFEQFDVLNLSPINCHLSFLDIENNRSTFRLTGKNGSTLIASQEINLDASPLWKKMVEDWKSGHFNDVDVLFTPYENLPEIGEIFKEILSKLPEDERPLPEDYPDGQYVVEGNCKYGYLGFSASRPPSEEEKEITRRIASEFGNVYQRFLDLQKAEAQAREAQIENALEKVRSRTMAMQHSDELTDVASLLFNQVSALGIKTWTAGFNVWSEDNNFYVDYLSTGGGFIEPYTVHTEKAEALRDVSNVRKSGVEFDVLYVEGEKIKQLYLELHKLDEKQYEILLRDDPIPSHQYEHFVFGSKVSLMFITYEPVPEAHDIFKRLGKVFDQTYTRFLDLQKAEAQARESEIQLALERVRARSLAMHRSEELADLSMELVKQVQALGMESWFCAFNIYDDDPRGSVEWGSNGQGTFPKYRTPRESAFLRYFEAGQRGETFLVNEIGDEECPAHYEYLCSLPGVGEQLLQMKAAGIPFPTSQIDHVAFFKYGYVLFITYEPAPESHDIFKRFANVFEQSYTRFLDLQKAEAQAKEAKIEAALERVRSRSLAMHKTDELQEVVRVVAEELKNIGVILDTWGAVICTYFQDSNDVIHWTASEDPANHSIAFFLPYFKDELYDEAWASKNRGDSYLAKVFSFDVKNAFFKHAFEHSDYRQLPDDYKKLILESESHGIAWAWAKNSAIMIPSIQGDLPSEEEKEILIRFARVFEQSFIRFLDLQKAEAQAREAQIETALERVRSKTMAMHNSQEVGESVATLFDELVGLSVLSMYDRCGIGIMQANELMEAWTAAKTPDGKAELTIGHLNMKGHPLLQSAYRGWIDKKEINQYILEGEDKLNYYDAIRGQSDYKIKRDYISEPVRIVHTDFYFNEGCLYVFSQNEFSAHSTSIFIRFAGVFGQTYRRYLDLQKAESQALEAIKRSSVDRVRAEIASMRTTSDLERIQPLIWNELKTLDVPFIRCGVFIMDEPKQEVHVFLSTPDGKSIAAFRLPYHSTEQSKQIVAHWVQKQIFKDHMDEAAFAEYTKNLVQQGAVASDEKYVTENRPKDLYLHFLPFLQGMLYVGNGASLQEDALQLVQNLADAFATAYARYEDFNKLEVAKSAVESAMTELRATQSQLVQQEKLASLGQLTAGIAHEIKNPLNFVNNFSEVSIEMIEEVLEERSKRQALRQSSGTEISAAEKLENEILEDIKSNLQKVYEHGTRANGIVTSMLQHSRGGSGKMEPTDLNALIKEYVNLSYHGMRANKNPIEVDIQLELEPGLESVSLIKEDFSRVIINLCNNAFDAMREKVKKYHPDSYREQSTKYQEEAESDVNYLPKLRVSTILENGQVRIFFEDNGPGIPDAIKDKILQPFFTTKKGTEGTGLGLSITHDIVKAHGGELNVESKEGQGSKFSVQLPKNNHK